MPLVSLSTPWKQKTSGKAVVFQFFRKQNDFWYLSVSSKIIVQEIEEKLPIFYNEKFVLKFSHYFCFYETWQRFWIFIESEKVPNLFYWILVERLQRLFLLLYLSAYLFRVFIVIQKFCVKYYVQEIIGYDFLLFSIH